MKTLIQTKMQIGSPTNKLNIGSNPNSAKFSSKRGITNDPIRDIPITQNYSPLSKENPLKNLITQSKQGISPKTSQSNNRIPNQMKPLTNSDKISYSMPMNKNLKSAQSKSFLPQQTKENFGKKTLVLDLDETLVHSSFNQFDQADIVLKIELENKIHNIFVLKRPGVEEFLERMSKVYEIVIYTASLSRYAESLIDILDPNKYCSYRLFREHCSFINSVYIKDLNKLGRPIKDTIIIDNTPASYALQVDNGIPIKSWYDDRDDRELYLLSPILEYLSSVFDIRDHMKRFIFSNEVSYKLAWQMINSQKNEILNQAKSISKPENPSNIDNEKKEKNYLNNDNASKNISEIPNNNDTDTNKSSKLSDNKMININIYNHNINHFIISPKDENKNGKNIKSFRTAYSNNTPIKPNDSLSLSANYNKKPSENLPSNEVFNNKITNTSNINKIETPKDNKIIQIKNISNNPNPKLISNIKIITNKTNYTTNSIQNHRPASAFSTKTRSSRVKSNSSLKDTSIKNSDSSILNRKDSATSFIKTNTNSNINRSVSASSYSANTAKSQKSKITFNKKQVQQMNNSKGNLTTRINPSVVKPVNSSVKKSIGIKVSITKNNITKVKRENSRDSLNSNNSKTSYSISSRSQDKKGHLSKNLKNLRLIDDPRFYDNKSNASDSSYSNVIDSKKGKFNKFPSLNKKNLQIRINSVNRNCNVTPKINKGNYNIKVAKVTNNLIGSYKLNENSAVMQDNSNNVFQKDK